LPTLAVDLLGAVRFPVAQHDPQRHAARQRLLQFFHQTRYLEDAEARHG
jgi:hypothetical protein